MKKGVLLNSPISSVISRLGHTDKITIADAGLPIPSSVERIDLALTQGIPDFMSVLQTITHEMQVEAVMLAEEIKTINPSLFNEILSYLYLLEQEQKKSIQIMYVSHEGLKKQLTENKAVIRTGECTPYANIVLFSGVTF
ncbi:MULTISPECIES: D-ribose pyranase [Proteus]|uniref:D-ribose pyranase n=2 Tax=Gammaproteobacteria TaxID=1236 RepID=A0A8I0WQ71_9GAMM|nr:MULTISPECIES: D-ribose pyranase [Proteus]MBG2914287.1 D-ribose pyranase [Proteus terrae subsp. cibarius]MBG3089136.1 D-ribose pyranase [Proteus terrae subsp. cibarius]MCM2367623.1 D-ribose pyranase [Proteus sp. FZP2095]QGW02058.1 D-ribose pyranase [Proteus terrae subsp. cibarius]QHD94723.1 D-ribose pyranase [Proteus terrae subsp. cibarius]